jgi:fibrillarin-like pre-rRNA processing protein
MPLMVKVISKAEGVPGVFTDGKDLFTVNAAPGKEVYGERFLNVDGVEYRQWDPTRSKLAAMILLGGKDFGLDQSSKVLYLGAASGTTASHVSDIVTNGFVYCIEFSERSFRDLVPVCESRKNMIPILADANQPHEYRHIIEAAELVYQDVAQRNQVEIFVRNMASFEAGHGILMLKSRSVNVNRKPKEVFAEVRKELVSACLKVKEIIDLERYAKDHAAFVVEE